MPDVTTDSVGAGVRIQVLFSQIWTVGSRVLVHSTDAYAIEVVGYDSRVSIYPFATVNSAGTVTIWTALVAENFKLSVAGSVLNSNINGKALLLNGPGAEIKTSAVVGDIKGQIYGTAVGIWLQSDSTTTTTQIINEGVIGSYFKAIMRDGAENVRVVNSGTIFATANDSDSGAFVDYFGGVDTIINTGTINGIVRFGGGNDVYSGASGRLLSGFPANIYGGDGNDTVTGGAGAEVFDGGNHNDTLRGNGGNDRLYGQAGVDKIYGGTGNDTIGGGIGNDTLYGDANNDTLRGEAGADTLYGGTGNDYLDGGTENDVLTGGTGADRLTGGLGADDFVFTNVADSRISGGRDTILDFNRAQGDDIWLRAIDANTKVAGNQNFKFIGTKAFSGAAGELRYQKVGTDSYIYADINGDKLVDMHIISNVAVSFVSSDFVL